jgi:predicted dehydrogenase
MIKVGVIGYGYWGPNLVRNFQQCESTSVTCVCDVHKEVLDRVRMTHPGVEGTVWTEELINNKDVDAVVIATPVSTHFDLAFDALKAGKHVFVEKPMTLTVEQSERLIDEADKRDLVLMVDHTFIYTAPVRKIGELVTSGELGDIYYYDSVRINLGLFQHDIDVLWDLAPHDLSIMQYVVPHRPCAVSATGMSHFTGEPENTAYMTIFFDGNCIGHIHANWMSPVKIRHTLVGGSKQMVVYNDLDPNETIKVYNKGVSINRNRESVHEMLVSYRSGDIHIPQLERMEALAVEVSHFADCIENKKTPLTDGQAGLDVVRILAAATESMSKQGRPVELS